MKVFDEISVDGHQHWVVKEATLSGRCDGCDKHIRKGEFIGYCPLQENEEKSYWCYDCCIDDDTPQIARSITAWKKHKRLQRLEQIKTDKADEE